MAVTELALLRLAPNLTLQNPSLLANLRKALKTMASFSCRPFYYLHQVEDPSLIYILGQWESLEQHYNQFIPSKGNQELLEEMKDQISVEWLMHLDVPVESVDLKAGCLSVGRHTVLTEKRDRFLKTFEEKRKYLDEYSTEGTAAGGWKLDKKEGESEEFVLFAPWKEVQQHMDFAKTDGFKEYGKIREFIEGFDVKHVTVLDLQEL